MTIYTPSNLIVTDPGLRLADAKSISNAINYHNSSSQAYSITAAGSNQGGAVQLTAVYNEVDTTATGTGVALPLSTGKANTPYQFCVVFNNGANPLQVYTAATGTDTINGVTGSTGISIPANTTTIFVAAKPGVWSTVGGGEVGNTVGGLASGSFSLASSTTLTAVTGMQSTLIAGATYNFDIYLSLSAAATPGLKINLGTLGTATATSFLADTWVYNTTTVSGQANQTTFGSNLFAGAVAATALTSQGTIVVNAGGTVILGAAQDVSNATALTIANNSYINFTRIA